MMKENLVEVVTTSPQHADRIPHYDVYRETRLFPSTMHTVTTTVPPLPLPPTVSHPDDCGTPRNADYADYIRTASSAICMACSRCETRTTAVP